MLQVSALLHGHYKGVQYLKDNNSASVSEL